MDKNFIEQYLYNYFDEVTPKEFYRAIFPKGELQKQGDYEKNKYNAIAVEITENKIKRYTITDELEQIDKLLKSDNFIIVSPISYCGKSRKSENARYMYALAIDLDGITELHYLVDLFHQIKIEFLPKPTYVISSGKGLHLYYVFKQPIPLFKNIVEQLSNLRIELIKVLWNKYVTTDYENIQYESLFQGFRLVGGVTKYGNRTKAFQVGNKIELEYLNNFVSEKNQVKDFVYKSKLTLAEAKEKYPQWYQDRIINHRPKKTWTCKKDLYKWWCKEIIGKTNVGHRYYNIMCLSIYAKKCGVSKKELEAKAFELLPYFDNISTSEDNRFTEYDILKALEMYNDSYITFPINSIERISGISIPRNKRNFRKQELHLQIMRATRDVLYPNNEWINKKGRPKGSTKDTTPKAVIVREWQKQNPQGSKNQCIKDTGISKHTVYKWWNNHKE